MKILVTGGTGFLGSHLVKHLALAHHVIVLVRKSSSLERLEKVLSQIQVIWLDAGITNADFQVPNYDVIIHCATNYGKREENFSQLLEDNVLWPTRLMEHALRNRASLFINTDTFFTKNLNYEYLKNYTLSKYIFTKILEQYATKINVANLRLQHVYGPNDSDDKFVPSIVNKLLGNPEVIELTEGFQRRDFIFINDVVEAYQVVIEKFTTISGFEEFEVGIGQSTSIREFVETAKKLIGNTETKLAWGSLASRKNEIIESTADIKKLINFNWKPKYSLEDGLTILIENIRKNGVKEHR